MLWRILGDAEVSIEDWKVAAEYGFGALALFWSGVYVVIPLRDRHIKFLDSTEETNKSLSKTIEKQADILQGMQAGLDKMNEKIDKMEEIVDKLTVVTQHMRMP